MGGNKLLVVSVDGLDHRYLRDRDAMGLKIPTLRRLMAEGETAQGVVGVVPTITWPSHTTIVTGVTPDKHGVLSNARMGAPLTESYWSVRVLKARTLYQCAADKGLTSAAITWPTTVDARIDWNLPEYFLRRNGGSMDLEAIAQVATPGLVEAISAAYPSFPQQWVDDRTRTLATLYLLKEKKPDLMLVHLVDLDSDQHDRGPFDSEARATLERIDELLADMLKLAEPAGYDVVITSDHGFERIDRVVNLPIRAAKDGVAGDLSARGGVATTKDKAVAEWLRRLSMEPGSGVGREIPREEYLRLSPQMADVIAAFEPADHTMFGGATTGDLVTAPHEKGAHGLWPLRADYRSSYLHWPRRGGPAQLPELQMTSLKDRLAAILAVDCP